MAAWRPAMRPHQQQGGQAVMRSRPVAGLLVSLVLTLLVSGCGGASPETRARQTKTALHGTSTPIPRRAVPAGIDEERATILTAEAFLPIATVAPATVSPILIGTVAATREAVIPGPRLTAAMIAGAMATAEARVCVGADRCDAVPDRLADARSTCTPSTWCRVGRVIPANGSTSLDAWLEVRTGRVTLIPQTNG
jgi:hypothetical protein